jgi:hypothetical protein
MAPSAAVRWNAAFVGIPTFLRSVIATDLDRLDADIAVMGVPSASYLAAHTIVEFLGWLCAQPWWIAGRDARLAARAAIRT